ncbi:hypothetical protein HMPREF7215_1412 [Pyramidobacter piscolens W5455]|uniref:Uncharacterized protein n=1 Tax=Pyramidobacter piscolens W5455 TaxID=352165 RepID=A0ABP2HRT1_9BACT|nr:hypothetical protein HMPREF7215_1412 [Pyramidobacter piscolens W5455]
MKISKQRSLVKPDAAAPLVLRPGTDVSKLLSPENLRVIAERLSTIKPTYTHYFVDNVPLLWIVFASWFQKSPWSQRSDRVFHMPRASRRA